MRLFEYRYNERNNLGPGDAVTYRILEGNYNRRNPTMGRAIASFDLAGAQGEHSLLRQMTWRFDFLLTSCSRFLGHPLQEIMKIQENQRGALNIDMHQW